ncbi:DNA mismatch repair protein MutS domain protein [uncultured Pleomorphomonas sp.]|uniref:DNA mismatch repair protein MutS domain protein n=1 Tax=uncultured Pleomorphomonas sp. TaxID=442121 RepID=A0A212LPP2_9HYPH|nr:DNA mismatch repair protein MutS [uncultured Pleomorphomonas sp.]SCM79534.1 DNA mismatch repair protein MutS domain protein [uncultured Pleomorphomonas sp.]
MQARSPAPPPAAAPPVAVSILAAGPATAFDGEPAEPSCFRDLNLDQIVAAATAPKAEYNLSPIFRAPLHDIDGVLYRQAIFRDLERPEVRATLDAFAGGMRALYANRRRIEAIRYERERQAWFLDGVLLYDEAVRGFAAAFAATELVSAGLIAFRDYLTAYAGAERFTRLAGAAAGLKRELAAVSYCIYLIGGHVHVGPLTDEPDFTEEILGVFEKFKEADARDHRVKLSDAGEMNHIEAGILDLVAALHADLFGRLDAFVAANAAFIDATLAAFDREAQFYLAWLDHIAPLEAHGLAFCYPEVTQGKAIGAEGTFDLALAAKLIKDGRTVVANDFQLSGAERILVVTGPNQGGKTTFARLFGQLHYLAALGCPVPGVAARLHLPDRVFTHFERPEVAGSERSKLEDDLMRMRDILAAATADSLVILNEIFTSTTLADAVWLSREVMTRLENRDVLGVWVTFIDELAAFSPATVSMVGGVDPDDEDSRTFRLTRRPADGLAYAMALAGRHGLTYRRLRERIP